MLIRRAEISKYGTADVRTSGQKITEVGALSPRLQETVVDAQGAALLPGLRDHHLHFLSYAASLNSVSCAEHESVEAFVAALHDAPRQSNGWIRAIQYHQSMGDLTLAHLDQAGPRTPIRIQHRTGRLWILNSLGIGLINEAAAQEPVCKQPNFQLGLQSGYFYGLDLELGRLIGQTTPDVGSASRRLASYGVVGFTDMTPGNSTYSAQAFARWQVEEKLLQQVQMAGRADLEIEPCSKIIPGPTKIHLHESHLPPFAELCDGITVSHESARPVAIHCTTEVELSFTIAAFVESGAVRGDRIEHASLCSQACLEQIRELGLWIVTQSNFIAERGDTYLAEVEESSQPNLYRGASFLDCQIPFAYGTDAPFGCANPWFSIAAATSRETKSAKYLSPEERVSPEQALAGFLGSLQQPSEPLEIRPGADADLVLLNKSWQSTRTNPASAKVRLTLNQGKPIYGAV